MSIQTKSGKIKLSRWVVKKVKTFGGRFLVKSTDADKFEEINDRLAQMRTSMSLRDKRFWKTLEETRKNEKDNLVDDKGFLRNLRPEMVFAEADVPPDALQPRLPPSSPRAAAIALLPALLRKPPNPTPFFSTALVASNSIGMRMVPNMNGEVDAGLVSLVDIPGLATHQQVVPTAVPFGATFSPIFYPASAASSLSSERILIEKRIIQRQVQKEQDAVLLRQERLAQLEAGHQTIEHMVGQGYHHQLFQREMAKQHIIQQRLIAQEELKREIMRREVQQQEIMKRQSLRDQMIAEQQELRKKEQASHERLISQERQFENQLLAQYKLSGILGLRGTVEKKEETKWAAQEDEVTDKNDIPRVQEVVEDEHGCKEIFLNGADGSEEVNEVEEEEEEDDEEEESDDENDLII
jgi:hypothetical protein